MVCFRYIIVNTLHRGDKATILIIIIIIITIIYNAKFRSKVP